jgi:hypothetical protein
MAILGMVVNPCRGFHEYVLDANQFGHFGFRGGIAV